MSDPTKTVSTYRPQVTTPPESAPEEVQETPAPTGQTSDGRKVRLAPGEVLKKLPIASLLYKLPKFSPRKLFNRLKQVLPLPKRTLTKADISEPRNQQTMHGIKTLMSRGYSEEDASKAVMDATMKAGDSLPEFNRHIAALPYKDARQGDVEKAVKKLESLGYSTSEAFEIAHTAVSWTQHQATERGYTEAWPAAASRQFHIRIKKSPAVGQAVIKQALSKKVHEASNGMQTLMEFGYDRKAALSHTLQAIKEHGSGTRELVNWLRSPETWPLKSASHDESEITEFFDSTLKPWMMGKLERKGYSAADQEGISATLIEGTGGAEACEIDHIMEATRNVPIEGKATSGSEMTVQQAKELLKIDSFTSRADISRAFRRQAKNCHPDKAKDQADADRRQVEFRILEEAKEALERTLKPSP